MFSISSRGASRGRAYFVPVKCRIAIRICIGHLPNGRESYRTVNVRGVSHGVTADGAEAVARALAPLLDGRIVCVRVVRTERLEFEAASRAAYDAFGVFGVLGTSGTAGNSGRREMPGERVEKVSRIGWAATPSGKALHGPNPPNVPMIMHLLR